MVEAAKRGAESRGYALVREPGRGLSNIWTITKDGQTKRASIRTTRNRWFAFQPLEKGTKWKTLDEVDVVIVASVDSADEPTNVEVFVLPADEVREGFSASHAARVKAGLIVQDNFGMWVALDFDDRDIPVAVGSGIAKKHKPVAVYPIEQLATEKDLAQTQHRADEGRAPGDAEALPPRCTTIAEVMAWARRRVAEIAGVQADAIKLDLKVQY